MKFKVIAVALCAVCIAAFAIAAGTEADKSLIPPIITPGTASTQDKAGTAPSSAAGDVVVLFDGNDLSAWVSDKTGGPAAWKVKDGCIETVPGAGYIRTEQAFGDCQLHIEWTAPSEVKGNGQGRGNSGVYLMGQYEVQILDSYNNETYVDGQAGAVYGQSPPLVNACRKPGQWQSYDIIFHAPVFDGDTLVKPATVTVLHNGLVIQDNWILKGNTFNRKRPSYKKHDAKLPLKLQDHSNPVRFRNIWIREL